MRQPAARPLPAATLLLLLLGAAVARAAPAEAGPQADAAGNTLVYLEAADDGGALELWSVSRAGGEPHRLSGGRAAGAGVTAFAISPDGVSVAFSAAAGDGRRRLYWVAIDDGLPRLIVDERFPDAEVVDFAFRSDAPVLDFRTASNPPSSFGLPAMIFADGFESADTSAWSDTTANPCPTPTGGPTLHANDVIANETWTANGSPHILTNNLSVAAGVTLTVEPCAQVRVRPGFDLTVRGTLSARGTAFRRITFTRDNAALPWDSIWVKSPGFADLAYVDLSGAGAAGAAVLAEGNDLLPAARPLLADHLKVTGSASYGVRLFRRAGFAVGSRSLLVTGAGATDPSAPFPVRMSLNTVGTLPVGSYTGNAGDLIQVVGEGNSAVEVDDAFHDRGVPYQIGGPAGQLGLIIVHGPPALATLTIDPGVELRFYSAGSNFGGLFVGTSGNPVPTGRLVAAGTAARPIVFTGAGGAPLAGSWEGITLFGALAVGNVLDHVRIDAAGRNGGDANFGCPPAAFPETSGALKIFSQPTSGFLTHSTISRSSTHGVFRAWTGTQVDFASGNTFENVAFCHQVLNRPPLPALCPTNPDCPQ